MNHSGECVEKFRLDGPFHTFMLQVEPNQLVVINQEMLFHQFSVTYDGQTNQIMNVSPALY